MLELLSNVDLRPFDNTLIHEKGWSPTSALGPYIPYFGDNFFGRHPLTIPKVAQGPFGQTMVAESVSELHETPGWDGGWNSRLVHVDGSKIHRQSIWFNVKVKGNVEGSSTLRGYLYHGTNHHDLAGVDPINDTVSHLYDTTPLQNPYFRVNRVSDMPEDQWFLVVGHVFPFNAPANQENHPDSGTWGMDGLPIPLASDGSDYRFGQFTNVLQSRVYHYYASIAGITVQYAYPRIDCCDGTEPSIAELLAGYGQDRRKKPINVRV